jgi:hypothetical protein
LLSEKVVKMQNKVKTLVIEGTGLLGIVLIHELTHWRKDVIVTV